MVSTLRELLHDNVDHPPADHTDLYAVLAAGRRRVRRRRHAAVAGTVVATAAVVTAAAVGWPGVTDRAGTADVPPTPDAPVLRLADAEPAVDGRDYRVLAAHTNENLDERNGQYFDGVTDDGLVVFRDGPHGAENTVRMALMDPATGEKDWLPATGETQLWPVSLGEDRLVFQDPGDRMRSEVAVLVLDRETRQWTRHTWPALPRVEEVRAVLGPDGRLYLGLPATRNTPPPGGWPVGPDGEADDAGAPGETYDLWSVSLTDSADVRDENLRFGELAFTDRDMVWTETTNGTNDRIFVRDLATGEQHDFDPDSGERCNLLSFGATGDRIVLGQYCGTYAAGVRDDRVQILSTDGEQVVTLQGNDLAGGLAGTSGLVAVSSYAPTRQGTFVYDLETDRLLRVSDGLSKWALGGPTPDDLFLWDTPVNQGHGATQHLGELVR